MMPMTPLEASTFALLHCEDFSDASPRRLVGTQAMAAQPVTLSSAQAKFGASSLDVQSATYGGLKLPGAFFLRDQVAATIEAWVWFKSFPARSCVIVCGYSASDQYGCFSISHDSAGKPVAVYRDANLNANLILGASALPTSQWVHLALTVDAARLRRLFVDGVLVGSGSGMAGAVGFRDSTATAFLGVGGDGGGNYSPNAYIDEVRYVFGHCLYTGDFTPPSAPFADPPPLDGATMRVGVARIAGYTPASQTTVKRSARYANLGDRVYGGRGSIAGTVKEKASPANVPLHRRVRLMRERDAIVIRETWSDAATGNYAFTDLDERERYTVIAYDYQRNYRAVVADNLTAEVT